MGGPRDDQLSNVDGVSGVERIAGAAGVQADVAARRTAASLPGPRDLHTSDPGRALVTGHCADIGAITMGQFRGLAARAPYVSNGSAKDLRELVDYYDRRFDMRLSGQEKQDLINFLGVL